MRSSNRRERPKWLAPREAVSLVSPRNVPRGEAEGNIEVEEKQNSLFPLGPLIRAYWICRAIGSHGDWGALYQNYSILNCSKMRRVAPTSLLVSTKRHFWKPSNKQWERKKVDDSLFDFPSPTRGSGFISKADEEFHFDLNEVMDGMKRRENVLAAHCSLFELNKTCGKRAPQNFLSEIFLAQSFL